MNRRKIRIGLVASSHSLTDRVQAPAAEQPNQIFLNTHGLNAAIPPALEVVRNGVKESSAVEEQSTSCVKICAFRCARFHIAHWISAPA
jgi:hypothetical protein